ncbi:MAG: UDP-N-acetylmuramoyl-L-alanine--D-glutamate ligase [Planctomycetota bacterium]
MRHDFEGQRVTVMGLGRFGGGVEVTRYLVEQGADVLVTDTADVEQLRPSLTKIADLIKSKAVSLRLGGHNVSDFTTRDAVVVNPAVPTPWDNRFVRAAMAAEKTILTEIAFTVDRIAEHPGHGSLIAVTGTAGKSTTASMIAEGLNAAGMRVVFGGNIGGSLLNSPDLASAGAIVLELSSAQLHWLGQTQLAPRVAVVTSFAPNHVDWHGSLFHYRQCKQSLLKHAGHAVLGPSVLDWPSPGERTAVPDPENIELRIPGAHNRLNAGLALAAIRAFGINNPLASEAISVFPGLPHRLQRVDGAGAHKGLTVFNDSKSTTPEATALALAALSDSGQKRVHLIAGGYDKGVDLSPMLARASNVAGVYAIGATASKLVSITSGALRCDTLEVALQAIAAKAKKGDAVLLSPGCSSWDQFNNYESRGNAFAELCERLL